jgi:hypothetical protein
VSADTPRLVQIYPEGPALAGLFLCSHSDVDSPIFIQYRFGAYQIYFRTDFGLSSDRIALTLIIQLDAVCFEAECSA